ncbi:proline--tRNA ligase [Candidatus Woesearchaeota archaeon]|nr:proline--tRNA ligase [Candidatus Woesearchaeota archaeon]
MAVEKEASKGITVRKDDDVSAWYTEVIQKADLMSYTDVSGCIIFKPASYFMWEILQREVDKRLKKLGVQNAYFPLFIPEKHLSREAEHVEGFAPEVAWVTHAGNTKLEERLAVRPTSETIMYPAYSEWIRSWRDLPLRLNQWNNVVRWEFKHSVPFLRTREFLWNEGHTVFATKEEAEAERAPIINLYLEVLKDVLAIYGSPGYKSEKEKFAGAVYTCSIESFLPIGRAIQGPDFHHDGQNFAKAYDIKFEDQNGQVQHAWQNTWAITTRMLGVMIMMHGDDKGLVLPPPVAPVQIVIVPILKTGDNRPVLDKADQIVKELSKEFRVHLDDRENYTPGWKYNEWELKGVPLRIEIGPKDLDADQAVLVRRDNGEKNFVKTADIMETSRVILLDIHRLLYFRSEENFTSAIVDVKNMDELKKAVENKKMALVPYCNDGECEDHIKEQTGGAKTLNSPFDKPLQTGAKCIRCGKEAKVNIYIAKSY